MDEHCSKRFLADADSHSYSGRLKYLTLCRSVVVSHRKQWRQHWHGALDGKSGSPTQNWVELEDEGWDGLVDAVERLRANPARAERIADNGVRTLRDRSVATFPSRSDPLAESHALCTGTSRQQASRATGDVCLRRVSLSLPHWLLRR